jgi:hypothetical protein
VRYTDSNNKGRGVGRFALSATRAGKLGIKQIQNLAATRQKVFNELVAVLRAHVQRGGATPWQKPAR